MPFFGDWFQAWCAAERAAVQAIRATALKSMLALERQGEPPSADEAEEVRRLRARANALFEHGMAALAAAR